MISESVNPQFSTTDSSFRMNAETTPPNDQIKGTANDSAIDNSELDDIYDRLHQVETDVTAIFQLEVFEEKGTKMKTLKEKLECVMKTYNDYKVEGTEELLELETVFEESTAPGFNACTTVLDFVEHAISHLKSTETSLSTIHGRVRHTLKEFDETFLRMFDPNHESAEAEISQRKCFCLLERALAEIENDHEKLEALDMKKEKISNLYKKNVKKIENEKIRCLQVTQLCETHIKDEIIVIQQASSHCTEIDQDEKRLCEIHEELMELEEKKKSLEREKEELENKRCTMHTVLLRKESFTKMSKTIFKLTETSKVTVIAIEKIEGSHFLIYKHLKTRHDEQRKQMTELRKKTFQYKKKILMYAIFLHKLLEAKCFESRKEAESKVEIFTQKLKIAHETFCREWVVQLRGEKCMSEVIEISYTDKYKFHKKEHERFEEILHTFEGKIGDQDEHSIQPDEFYQQLESVVEQYCAERTHHDDLPNVRFFADHGCV